tara:strand:- start:153 stop:296 length:144 start_codon:yes stop_codon:yes gene_type:complete
MGLSRDIFTMGLSRDSVGWNITMGLSRDSTLSTEIWYTGLGNSNKKQ